MLKIVFNWWSVMMGLCMLLFPCLQLDVNYEEEVGENAIVEVEQDVSNNEVPKETIAPEILYGDYGCVVIPTVGLVQPVNYREYTHPSHYTAVQNAIDAEMSSCLYNFFGNLILSDHYNQEFWRILNINIGDEVYLYKTDGTIDVYRCVEIGSGQFPGVGIYYNHNNLQNVKYSGLFIETCNGDDNVNTFMARLMKG